jgi:septal ring factor EnvC (AmiA/AmiB activator)
MEVADGQHMPNSTSYQIGMLTGTITALQTQLTVMSQDTQRGQDSIKTLLTEHANRTDAAITLQREQRESDLKESEKQRSLDRAEMKTLKERADKAEGALRLMMWFFVPAGFFFSLFVFAWQAWNSAMIGKK